MLWLGFDPGGAKNFGAALLDLTNPAPRFETKTFSIADEALRWACELTKGVVPTAAGIDTIVFWSKGMAGWRAADFWLRERYPEVALSVQAPNSLHGSMLIQGMTIAILLRQQWPDIKITETHPKILYYAQCNRKYCWPDDRARMQAWLRGKLHLATLDLKTEHEFDALMSAWAAREGFSRKWHNDLRNRFSSDQVLEPAGPVSYWWPE